MFHEPVAHFLAHNQHYKSMKFSREFEYLHQGKYFVMSQNMQHRFSQHLDQHDHRGFDRQIEKPCSSASGHLLISHQEQCPSPQNQWEILMNDQSANIHNIY